MAVTAKHKKARAFRDFLIETESINMFKEEERENAILFRSIYPVREDDKKQFMLIIDDSVYITMQALIVPKVQEECYEDVLKLINQIHLEYPTVKYVLTPTGEVMTSMVFHATEKSIDPGVMVRCVIKFFEVLKENHYDRFNAIIAK